MQALIDGDIVLYRCGYATDSKGEDLEHGILRLDTMIERILDETNADSYRLFMSDTLENNFRYAIDNTYKGNRKQPKPIHHEQLKEFLFSDWHAELAEASEADDMLSITQVQEYGRGHFYPPSIIVSIDKDLDQCFGLHYNFVKQEKYAVHIPNDLKWFYRQLLIGDTVDNVKGVMGIGLVKSKKLIEPLTTEIEMFNTVRTLYNDDKRLLKNMRLLWIRRQPEEIKGFPC